MEATVTNNNSRADAFAFSRAESMAGKVLAEADDVERELKHIHDSLDEHSRQGRRYSIAAMLLGIIGPIVAVISRGGPLGTSVAAFAAGLGFAAIFQSIRLMRQGLKSSKAAGYRASRFMLVSSVSLIEEVGRGLATEKLGVQAETAPLKSIFEFLIEAGVWNSRDVASYRTALNIRNVIVHNDSVRTLDSQDVADAVSESRRLLDKLSVQLKTTSAQQADNGSE